MKNLKAKDIMNSGVITVRDDMSVHNLANFFTDRMISGAPVVDKNGKLIGVVSLSDIVRNDARRTAIVEEQLDASYYLHGWEDKLNDEDVQQLHLEQNDGLTIRDIMTPLIFKVSEETSLAEMADTMIGGRIHRLIVTNNDEVVGIVTTLDMLQAIRSNAEK
ncbi:MAG: CBS domain-containing protein [bacterium]